jgi:transcriptional regulator with XRE-family HTH domain
MDELKIIGQNIVKYRKQKNMTQEDLCGVAEIDRSYLSEVENGKANVSVETLVKITNALDINLAEILINKLKK